MSDLRDPSRNPLVIPDETPKRARGCPMCRSLNFTGYSAGGAVEWTCGDCGNKWQGGIGQVPIDPREPVPPADPRTRPIVDFAKTKESRFLEPFVDRKPDPTQSFRKGAPIPGEDDDG